MKEKIGWYLLLGGGALFAFNLYAGLKADSAGNLPSWYPSALVTVESMSPIAVEYVLLGSGAALIWLF